MLKFPFFQTDSLSACDGNSADELHKHVSACDNGWLEKNIKSVPDILNGLLGTVFVPDEGKRFAMFSFRQLNQSVLHWLAQANFAACAEGEDFPPEAPLVAEYFPTRDYRQIDFLKLFANGRCVCQYRDLSNLNTALTKWNGSGNLIHKGLLLDNSGYC